MNHHSVYLTIYFGHNSPLFAAGVLIDNQHVLTLASNLYNRCTRKAASQICIGTIDGKQYDAQSIFIPLFFYRLGEQEFESHDYALIVLKSQVDQIKPLVLHVPPSEFKDKMTIVASPVKFIARKGFERCEQTSVDTHMISRDHVYISYDTVSVGEGTAGSPIYSHQNVLVGLHHGDFFVGNEDEDANSSSSYGMLLTQKMVTFIQTHMTVGKTDAI